MAKTALPSNQPMKPTAPWRDNFSELATDPARGLSLSRQVIQPSRLSLLLALLLFSSVGVYAQTEDAPRLTEAKVIEIAEAKIRPQDLALYRRGPALYVHASKVWELGYRPKKRRDALGNRIPPMKFYIDDTTGFVTKHLMWRP